MQTQPRLYSVKQIANDCGISKARVRTFLRAVGHGIAPVALFGRTKVYTETVHALVCHCVRLHALRSVRLSGGPQLGDAEKKANHAALGYLVAVYHEQNWTAPEAEQQAATIDRLAWGGRLASLAN